MDRGQRRLEASRSQTARVKLTIEKAFGTNAHWYDLWLAEWRTQTGCTEKLCKQRSPIDGGRRLSKGPRVAKLPVDRGTEHADLQGRTRQNVAIRHIPKGGSPVLRSDWMALTSWKEKAGRDAQAKGEGDKRREQWEQPGRIINKTRGGARGGGKKTLNGHWENAWVAAVEKFVAEEAIPVRIA